MSIPPGPWPHHLGQTGAQFMAVERAAAKGHGKGGGKMPQQKPKPGHAPPTPAYGYVTIYSIDPWGVALTALLGDSPPTPTGGGGGMESVPMPGAIPISVYHGPTQLLCDLSIVVDNFTANAAHPGGGLNANEEIGAIVALQGLANRDAPPPVCKVVAPGSSFLHGWAQWTVDDVSWGAAEMNSEANRSLQVVTLHLAEYRQEDRIGSVAKGSVPKKRASKHHKKNKTSASGPQYVIVHEGETLQQIAWNLGLASWRPLAAAQHPPITDPRSIRVGQRLRLPKGFGAVVVVS